MVLDDHAALTPAGKPVEVPMPVATAVVWVIFNAVFRQPDDDDATLAENTAIETLLLLAVEDVTHSALLVNSQVIISPFAKAASVYNELLIPTLTPFFFH